MRTLYTKFIIYTLGIMLLSFTLTFILINSFYHQQFKQTNDEKNVAIAESITLFIERNDSLVLDDYLQSVAETGYKLFLVDESSDTYSFGEPFKRDNLSEEAIGLVLNGDVYHGMADLPKETFVTGLFADELANTVGVPFTFKDSDYALFLRPNIKMLFTEIHYLLGGLFIGMGVISLLAMLIVAKMLINPITKLTTATKKVSREQFLVDLPTNRHDEIGELAQSFEKMTDELREADNMRKQFISNVSHDFQTPLLNIKGYTDLLKNEDTNDDTKQEYLHIIELEVERLSSLTKQLLLLTSLDQLSTLVNKKSFSLTSLLKETIYAYQWLLHEKNISLTIDADDISYYGDKALLENVFDNLLSNAIKYTDEFGSIKMSLTEREHDIKIDIEDSGIGIDAHHIPHLFERFYRVDESRHEKIEGTGLGLSIVEQIVLLHDGHVKVSSKKDVGTKFSVTLPKL